MYQFFFFIARGEMVHACTGVAAFLSHYDFFFFVILLFCLFHRFYLCLFLLLSFVLKKKGIYY